MITGSTLTFIGGLIGVALAILKAINWIQGKKNAELRQAVEKARRLSNRSRTKRGAIIKLRKWREKQSDR